jgi:hypothetical protein
MVFKNDAQGFTKDSTKMLFLPRFNDNLSQFFTIQLIVWFIRSIYLIDFLSFVYLFIEELVILLGRSSVEIRARMSFRYITYAVYSVINTKYFIDYILLLSTPILYKGVPISSEDEFNRWIDLADKQKQLYVINGILTVLLITRIMEMIRAKFRTALLLVFYSFEAVSKIILGFFIVDFG